MPRYTFVTDDGEQFEHVCGYKELPETITLSDGRIAKRDFAADCRTVSTASSAGWPITCYASGVHASQAQELRDYYKSHGCPTEVTNNGDPIYTSSSHQKKALKCRGLVNKSSYC